MRIICLWCFLLPGIALGQPFFEEHDKGWYWYEKTLQIIPKRKKNESDRKIKDNFYPATRHMKNLQQRVTESLNKAILYPTQENLVNYANAYYQVINQGQYFADAYKMMLLKYPQYDYYLKYPINHNARLIHERIQDERNKQSIHEMAKTYGFLFFFSSQCHYCHIFAPTVKRFAERYNIHVLAISMDGGSLEEFPNAVPDNGIAKKLQVSSWPALFAVNPRSQQILPLANGVISVSELEDIIFKYAKFNHQAKNSSSVSH